MKQKLLLLSNSTNPGEKYLEYSLEYIRKFLGDVPQTALFIPYAAVTFSYDEYERKVAECFQEIGHSVCSIHHYENTREAVEKASLIIVGGGNTWKLVKTLQDNQLMDVIRQKVLSGTPYIGWSAGSNIACPTLKTTNDMPIVQPSDFSTLGLVPFQINPHYTDAHPSGLGGETREDRIQEFITVNQDVIVVGLREGTLLWYENNQIKLIGNRSARIFRYHQETIELTATDNFSFLI